MVRIGEGDGKYYEDYKRDNPPAGSKKSGGSSGNIQDEYQKHLQETRSKKRLQTMHLPTLQSPK